VPGPLPRFDTARGNVSARAIVLAGEAYLAQQPRLRRVIIPITSHMVATEPLTAEQWATIGWDNREVLGGFGSLNGYINHTEDGRIAFGAYRGRYPFNSEISDKLDKPEDIFIHAREAARDWFPVLAEQKVQFTHAWGGVLGVPRDHMPLMTYDRASGVATGRGYTGEGVATANLSGRVLADLITERDTDLTRLPMTRHQERLWEPEPIRWTGVQSVRQLRQRAIAETERTGARPDKPSLVQRVVTRLWES
jgi:glycine/D-amino acid oxidase-like deaminating enzyme